MIETMLAVFLFAAWEQQACEGLAELDKAYNALYLAMDDTDWSGIPADGSLDAPFEHARKTGEAVIAAIGDSATEGMTTVAELERRHAAMVSGWEAGDIAAWEGALGQAQGTAASLRRHNCE